MAVSPWTEVQTKKALLLYFQLPFGQLHKGNPDIVRLADQLGRTPSSVAMKLANFASLDPKIVSSGRKGLTGASALDRRVWDLFQQDWTKQIIEGADSFAAPDSSAPDANAFRDERLTFNYPSGDGATSKRGEVEQRVGQNFFRRAVLANFGNSCCVTGIIEPRLLIASHISPWSEDIPNRHNPRNGLSLSATFDKAFDAHLMTVTTELKVRLSPKLLNSKSAETRAFFADFEGKPISQPTHIALDLSLLEQHNNSVQF